MQIDAPELSTDCYGRPALRALDRPGAEGTRVSLLRDPGSTIATGTAAAAVRLVGNLNVNVELVRVGAAAPYFFRNERGRFAADLLDAAGDARDARRGFWGACPGAELNTGLGSVTGPA